MKKIILAATLCIASIGMTNLKSLADSMPYEPVFEAVPISEPVASTPAANPATQITPINNTEEASTLNSIESTNLQNALMQLDGAQVEIRNQLLKYKSEYSDIDTQYKLIKEQRSQKAKLIRETEKKIKSLDATKEKIRKNLN